MGWELRFSKHNDMTIICKMGLGSRMHLEIHTKYVNCHNMDAQCYLISFVRTHKTNCKFTFDYPYIIM